MYNGAQYTTLISQETAGGLIVEINEDATDAIATYLNNTTNGFNARVTLLGK